MLQQQRGGGTKTDYLTAKKKKKKKATTGTSSRAFDLPVEIIEEGEQIEAQLAPGLLLAVVEDVGVHHAHGVVHDLGAVSRPVEKPEKEERERSLARTRSGWRGGGRI